MKHGDLIRLQHAWKMTNWERQRSPSPTYTRERQHRHLQVAPVTRLHTDAKSALSCDWRFQFPSSLIFISLLNLSGGLTININCHGDSVVELWKSLVWKTNVLPIPSKSMIHKSFSTEPWIVRQTSDFPCCQRNLQVLCCFRTAKCQEGSCLLAFPSDLSDPDNTKRKGLCGFLLCPFKSLRSTHTFQANTYVTG